MDWRPRTSEASSRVENEVLPANPELGIFTERLALIEAGRPLLVRVEIDHRWSGVRRTLELRRIDTCGA